MRSAIAVLLTLGLGSLGCRGRTEPPLPITRIADSAGIQVVTVPEVDGPPPWSPSDICRFGGTDTGPEAFAQVDQATVATDGDSRIHVLRPDVSTVEVFDAACRHVASLARSGDGPGELRAPAAIAIASSGEIQVFDAARQALVRWTSQFEVLPPVTWDRGSSLPNGALRIEDGRAVFLAARGGRGTMTHFLTIVDEAGRADLDSVVNPFPTPVMTRCGMLMLDPLFVPQPLWSRRGGRTAFASSDRYEIRLYDGTRLVRIVRRALRAPVTEPGDAARAQPEGQRIGSCTVPVEELVEKRGVAATRPVIAGLGLDERGRLWVERWDFPDQAPLTDLYGEDGRYLGTFPDLAAPLATLRGDRLVVPVRDPVTGVSHLKIVAP